MIAKFSNYVNFAGTLFTGIEITADIWIIIVDSSWVAWTFLTSWKVEKSDPTVVACSTGSIFFASAFAGCFITESVWFSSILVTLAGNAKTFFCLVEAVSTFITSHARVLRFTITLSNNWIAWSDAVGVNHRTGRGAITISALRKGMIARGTFSALISCVTVRTETD